MNTSLGYSKKTLTDTSVLLSGGGDKPLSDFIGSISWDSTDRVLKYTPVGGSITDLVTFGSNAFDSTAYLPLAGGTLTGQLCVNYEQDVGLNQNGSFIIGPKAGQNLAFDSNEIMSRNNGAASTLYLNSEGGAICLNQGGGNTGIGTNSPSYKLHVNGKGRMLNINLFPGSLTSYTEGMRIHVSNGGWAAIALCGSDNTGDTGTSAKTWGIFNCDGAFYINKNSSSAAAATRLYGHTNGYTIGNLATTTYTLNVGGTGAFAGNVIPLTTDTYDLGTSSLSWNLLFINKIKTANYELSEDSTGRLSFGTADQTAAKGINIGNLLVSSAWTDYTNVPTNGIYSKGQIKSGVANGTAPFDITSTTLVSNLNADLLDGKNLDDIYREWEAYAGKTYVGWIKIIEFPLNNSNYVSIGEYILTFYRTFNSPLPESYMLGFVGAWGINSIKLQQLGSSVASLMIDQVRFVMDTANHKMWLEMHVKTNYTRYQNTVYLRLYGRNINSLKLTLCCTVQTEDDSTLTKGTTYTLYTNKAYIYGNLSGNSTTATTLAATKKINGTDFDGSTDITTANWGTSRTITIGSTGKSINGSDDVSWSLSDIGAAASGHDHNSSYVRLDPGAAEQTIKSSIGSLSEGVIDLWRSSGDHYTFLGFSNGTSKTYLGGIGFKALSDHNLYRKDGSNYYMINDSSNSSVSGGGDTWGSSITVKIGGTTKTLTIPSPGSAGTANSLTSLDVTKSFIYATLSANVTAANFTLSAAMTVGLCLTVLVYNSGSTSISIGIPSSWLTLDGYTLYCSATKFLEISIVRYSSGANDYIVSSKAQ